MIGGLSDRIDVGRAGFPAHGCHGGSEGGLTGTDVDDAEGVHFADEHYAVGGPASRSAGGTPVDSTATPSRASSSCPGRLPTRRGRARDQGFARYYLGYLARNRGDTVPARSWMHDALDRFGEESERWRPHYELGWRATSKR